MSEHVRRVLLFKFDCIVRSMSDGRTDCGSCGRSIRDWSQVHVVCAQESNYETLCKRSRCDGM